MIHLNVAFLVIRPTFNTIVKILINASPLVVNKYRRVTDFSVHLLIQYGGWNAQRAFIKAQSTGVITRVNIWNS